jgi:poly-gamma-glutamate system protein
MKFIQNISIRSTYVLSFLALLSICLFLLVENSKHFIKEDNYKEKLAASKLTKKAFDHIKDVRFQNEVYLDNINDPRETGLIGEQYSQITTGSGSLPIKSATINPNFGALIVEQLQELNLKEGDHVAICMTGSFPALNIALLAALQTLKIEATIISSLTSSSWGANDPNFTWLDIQTELNRAGIINLKSKACSIGGNQDIGRGISIEGREMIVNSILKNHVTYLNKGSVEANITERMRIFKTAEKPIKAFINVGGGNASIGGEVNGHSIKAGINKGLLLKDFPSKNGVLFEMAKLKIPILHLLKIENLMNKYDIPLEHDFEPVLGKGKLFSSYKYQVTIVIMAALLMVICFIAIILIDKKQNAIGNDIIHTIN